MPRVIPWQQYLAQQPKNNAAKSFFYHLKWILFWNWFFFSQKLLQYGKKNFFFAFLGVDCWKPVRQGHTVGSSAPQKRRKIIFLPLLKQIFAKKFNYKAKFPRNDEKTILHHFWDTAVENIVAAGPEIQHPT